MEVRSGGQVGLDAAARLFAGEIGMTSRIKGGSFLSPTGAAGRRVFFAGALTSVSSGGGRVLARIADPTGSITVVAGWREAAAASALQAIEPPAFAAVSGALASTGGETVIVPETVVRVERSVRDLWVLRTADLTLSRIERMIDAPADPGARAAAAHYKTTPAALADLAQMIQAALRTVQDSTGPAAPIDARTVLVALLEEAPGRRAAEETLLAAVQGRGIGRDAAKTALEALMEEGECYMPSTGQVKLI
jgi:RPA family protein